MPLVDTHAHLLPEYYPDGERDAVLERAREVGVVAVINVATSLADAPHALAMATTRAQVWATCGVHPHEARTIDERGFEELGRRVRHPRVVAVGECGLDYHYDHSPREVQREVLRRQIRLACAVGKPLVLHNRESDGDFVAILEEEKACRVGGVVHAFSTRLEVARRCLDLGFHLGFGGMITFPKAEAVREALRATPRDRLLFETDAPYLSPVPYRGRRNEPGFVRVVAERAARERGEPVERLGRLTTRNASRLFGLGLDEATEEE